MLRNILPLALMVATSPALARAERPGGFEPALPVLETRAPRPPSGGIFNPGAGYAALHEGQRARLVGDPLTILLVERTTSSKSVSSRSARNGSASITPPAAGPLSLDPDALKAGGDSSFKGEGSAGQTSSLSSTLAVTIAEVRPNGTALVRGEKRMLLSQGHEWVRFSGIVRLADIDQDNRVASTRVADARIEYAGKGALQQASRQGWLGRFFNMISPF